jgi:kynurenine formamidase
MLPPVLEGVRIVDLTQTVGPATPPWPEGGVPLEAKVTVTYDEGGCYVRRIALDEHYGTHFDAPAHYARDGLRVDAVPASSLVRPAVVVDVREASAVDPDHKVPAETFTAWEAEHGAIEAGAAVLVMTGWDAHRGDPGRYLSDLRFPGLSTDAGRLLVERRVAGIGIDTLGIDPGCEPDCPVHHITMPAGLWHLEGLIGLDRLPVRGAWIVAGAMRLEDGSGAPARVIALVP